MARIESMAQLRQLVPAPGDRAYMKIGDHLCGQAQDFIRRSPFVMIGTLGPWGLEISQKGDHPGFVEIADEKTVLIPERKGNQFALSLGNILDDERIALAFLRPATDEVLRVSGRAALVDDGDICARLAAGGKPAVLAIRVAIDRAAFHCVRSARRAGLWNPATWDAPAPVSFGRIYAEALGQSDARALFDRLTEESNASLY